VLQNGNGGIVLRSDLEIQGSAITPEKKTESANNEREGSDQKPYSQTLTIKEPNVKNFGPVQMSVATRSNTSTLTKAAV
jgi:hypothetical protein